MRPTAVRLVACHRMPERSLFFRGRQLPVCARCTGMLAGYLAYPLFLTGVLSIGFWWALALNLPAFVDGTTQALGMRESTNGLRLATGLVSGVGQVGLISVVGKFLAMLLLTHFFGG